MADKQRESAASTKSKEKTSLLDLDIGKDFLTSWKSMSVTEDDPMDFDFSSVAKGKKKAFNFDNVDMDFNLDTDFGKISSFKVDIPDLDVSSPVKKAGKPQEKSKEVSTDGKTQGKSDELSFQFDFNEFDDLNFGSCPVKKAKQTKLNRDAEKSSSISGSLGFGTNLKENIGTSEGETTSKFHGQHAGEPNSSCKDKLPASLTEVHFPSKSDKFKDQATELVATTSPEKPIVNSTQDTYQEIFPQEKITLPESHAKEACGNSSVQSESENSSTHETAADDSQEGVRCLAQRESSGTGGEQNIYDEKPDSSFDCGNSQLDKLPVDMACSQSNNSETMHFAGDAPVEIGYKDDVDPTQDDKQFEQSSRKSVSRESFHESEADGKSMDLTPELVVTQLTCGNTGEKEIPVKERVTEGVRSKYFKGSDETKSQLQQSSSSQTNVTTTDSRRIDTVQPSPTDEGGTMVHKSMPDKECVTNIRSQNLKGLDEATSQRQQSSLSQKKLGTIGSKKITTVQLSTAHDRKLDNKDAPSGGNLVSLPRALPREQSKGDTPQIKCQGSSKDFACNRGGFSPDNTVRSLIGTSRLHDKDAEKGEHVRNGNDNIKDNNTFRKLGNKDAQSKSKLVALPRALAKEQIKGDSVETRSQGSPKDPTSNRGGFNCDNTSRTLIDTSRIHDKEVGKAELVLNGSENNMKDLNTFSSHVRPSGLIELKSKSASLIGLNPRLPVCSMKSSHNKKIISSDNNNISNIKDGVQISSLSNLNNMRNEETIYPPSAFTLQKDIKFIANSGKSVDSKDNTVFRMTHPADTRKRTSSSPTLKRKMSEESHANMLILKPPARVTESPRKRRNVIVSPDKFAENENMIDRSTDNVLNTSQSSTLHTPQKVSMKELEASLTIDNDTNVENAEACAKELDNITIKERLEAELKPMLANMLKKKHEEAKEILVRAVVNNNKLLMLNHPAYEEKICMIEKFGAILLSK